MTAQILDGRQISAEIVADVRAKVDARLAQGLRAPCLAVVLAWMSSNAASMRYVVR